jgi:hypothetical protein
VICIVGMPRSGTSLVTQLLHRCGLHLGPPEQLMPASINNADGFWENLRFVGLNERLLATNGGSWFVPPATLVATPKITAQAKSILAQFEGREPWGWKDPRNTLTLPFWKNLLPSIKVLVCVRHPAEAAASLVASTLVPRAFYWSVTRPGSPIRLRDGGSLLHERLWGVVRTSTSRHVRRTLAYEACLELWRVYNTRALEETGAVDRLVTHYDAMMTRPRAALERILTFAGMQISSDALEEATRFVSPRLRHQRAGNTELEPELTTLYARLSHEAEYELSDQPATRRPLSTVSNISA